MPSERRSLRYCLDANLSYKVAEALALVEHPVTHVATERALGSGGRVKGQQPAADEEIAHFCARSELVLVTIDSDFRGRWERTGLLANAGVEVIVFTTELVGLAEQHRIITASLPGWSSELGRQPSYGYRRWSQHPRRRTPDLIIGKKAKRAQRKRAPAPVRRSP